MRERGVGRGGVGEREGSVIDGVGREREGGGGGGWRENNLFASSHLCLSLRVGFY